MSYIVTDITDDIHTLGGYSTLLDAEAAISTHLGIENLANWTVNILEATKREYYQNPNAIEGNRFLIEEIS